MLLACAEGYQWSPVRDFLSRRALSRLETVGSHLYQRVTTGVNIEATYIPGENAFSVLGTNTPQTLAVLSRVLGCQTPWQEAKPSLISAGVQADMLSSSLSIAGCWSPFEALLRAIVGQQVSVTAAVKQINLLVELVEQQHGPQTDFPSPELCARTDFSGLGMPERRKKTIADVCDAIAQIGELTSSEQLDELIAIKGIGEWTLNYVRLRGFALPDIYLANDLIVKKMLTRFDIDANKAIPWRSYLCLQTWEWSSLGI